MLDARRHPLLTVEADPVSVESRLAAGALSCPACLGLLVPWGWAADRRVHGVDGVLRPRRARCVACLVTHVLLPVTMLARRAYSAATVMAALVAKAAGLGHRAVAVRLGVPAGTVRGWLRRMAGRLGAVRAVFARVAVTTAAGVTAPTGAGSPWRDMVAAVGTAAAAWRHRFGTAGVVGTVTAWQAAAALSNGRLLAPGWPASGPAGSATRVVPGGGAI